MTLIEQLALQLVPRLTRPAMPKATRPMVAPASRFRETRLGAPLPVNVLRVVPMDADQVQAQREELLGRIDDARPPRHTPPGAVNLLAPTPPPAPPPTGRWRAACRARCASTGLRCRMLEGHEGAHVSERGAFSRELPAGATARRSIDDVSTRRTGEQT